MKNTIELTELQYQELLELIFLGDQLKTLHIVPESYEHLTGLPSTLLRNHIFSKAKQFNSEYLIEYHQDLKDQYFLKAGDELIEDFIGV